MLTTCETPVELFNHSKLCLLLVKMLSIQNDFSQLMLMKLTFDLWYDMRRVPITPCLPNTHLFTFKLDSYSSSGVFEILLLIGIFQYVYDKKLCTTTLKLIRPDICDMHGLV